MDITIQQLYKKIEIERKILHGAKNMGSQLTDPNVIEVCNLKILESQKRLQFLESEMQKLILQQNNISNTAARKSETTNPKSKDQASRVSSDEEELSSGSGDSQEEDNIDDSMSDINSITESNQDLNLFPKNGKFPSRISTTFDKVMTIEGHQSNSLKRPDFNREPTRANSDIEHYNHALSSVKSVQRVGSGSLFAWPRSKTQSGAKSPSSPVRNLTRENSASSGMFDRVLTILRTKSTTDPTSPIKNMVSAAVSMGSISELGPAQVIEPLTDFGRFFHHKKSIT
jgi:hypothetical protein